MYFINICKIYFSFCQDGLEVVDFFYKKMNLFDDKSWKKKKILEMEVMDY